MGNQRVLTPLGVLATHHTAHVACYHPIIKRMDIWHVSEDCEAGYMLKMI